MSKTAEEVNKPGPLEEAILDAYRAVRQARDIGPQEPNYAQGEVWPDGDAKRVFDGLFESQEWLYGTLLLVRRMHL